ncbi:MAG: TRAP transporter fused permease subunit [Proteobacteria bacterium]|nr:TRAP transporter fused permease subunit [Pseudomonadota bacterium]
MRARLRQAIEGRWTGLAYVLSVACTFYYAYVAFFGITTPSLDRSLFIFVGVAVTLCLHPLPGGLAGRIFDALLLALATAATVRFNLMYDTFLMIAGLPISGLDIVLGWTITILCLEAARRVLGPAIPLIAALFLAYLYFGPFAPGPLRHSGFDLDTIASNLFAGTEGLYGVITYILASTLFLFLVFGQFLTRSGASDFYSDVCLSFLGWRAGGGAKAAVASSFIVGSITGSAAANVAITGVITIPLMKRTGYEPHIAAATEAAASTGGTILPPVMGVAAFVMVALTGIPYVQIALYATVPAILYFLNVFLQVHFYAMRNGLKGLPREECPGFLETLRRGWPFFIPLAIVVAMVYRGYSLSRIGLIAIVVTILCSWVSPRTRMGPRAILDAMADGTRMALPIITVAGPVSAMTLAILMPGTGLKITGLLINLAGGNLAIAVALIFIIGYVLGMGLSVVPSYIILATLAAPALIRLDVPVMAAHFVVMWWGQASNITPPVALAAYVAANIAGSPMWRTGMAAVVKGAGLFYLPVLFVYQPGLLMQGGPWQILVTVGSIVVGIVVLSAAVEGYFRRPLSVPARVVMGALGAVAIVSQNPFVIGGSLAIILGVYWADGWIAAARKG